MDNDQVKTGSSTCPGFQVISLVSFVADKFSLGVILGLTLVSPYSSLPLNFIICSTANQLSCRLELARRDRRRHSECEYQAPVLM